MGNIMSDPKYRIIPVIIHDNHLQSIPPVYEIKGPCPFDDILYTTGLGDYQYLNQRNPQNTLAARMAYMLHARYRPLDDIMEGEEEDDDKGVALLKQIYNDMDKDKHQKIHKTNALSALFLGYTGVVREQIQTIIIFVIT